MNNGKEYKVDALELRTELTIPQNSHLKIISDHADVILQKHTGKVLLNMSFGEFSSSSLNNLQAKTDTSSVNIDSVKNADLNLQNSQLNIVTSQLLQLTSSMSHINSDHIDSLIVKKSLNDQFTLNSINKISVNDSLFSSYQLERINQSLIFIGKNTDIKVADFNENTKLVSITNSNAEIKLALKNLNNYQLNFHNPQFNQFDKPKDLKLQMSNIDKTEVYQKGQSHQLSKINLDCKHCTIKLE